MLSAISAESLKLRRHRATWFLVWIFPIALIVLPTIAILIDLAKGSPPGRAPELSAWIDNATDFWDAPGSSLVRYLTCAYVAIVFAGEYGWNTWKLIVPHRARATLIASKYVVVVGLLYAAFILAALIMTGMSWLEDVLTGDPIPQGITFGALAEAHWIGFVSTLPTVLLTIAVASLAAILTRSTTAALVIGIVAITVEQLIRAFGPALSIYLGSAMELIYQILPGYHLGNLHAWITEGTGQSVPFPSGAMVDYSWSGSLAVIAAWIVGLIGLTFWRFKKQDIN